MRAQYGPRRDIQNKKDEIKNTFRAMIEQDPVGAQEFSVDPWMLLQQEVLP